MRRYEISITDQNGLPKVINGSNGQPIFNGTFSSTTLGGQTIPGALNVEMDLPVSTINSPIGGASLVIYGVGLPLLAQTDNFNPSISTNGNGVPVEYCNIKISGGMARGLPLAKPSQYGVLLNSQIQQAYGNWQGTHQTLDLIMVAPAGSQNTPYNFSFKCENNAPLEPSIRATLMNVFPNASAININISANLIAFEQIDAQYFTFGEFATFLSEKSRGILKGSYPGIQISYIENVINVYDYTVPAVAAPIQIEFDDLIGQPTWIGPVALTFKTVMRYDIKVGAKIRMPAKSASSGLILTTPASLSQYRNSSIFHGEFFVTMVRHLGIFRQGDANSWVTVIQARYQPQTGSVNMSITLGGEG